VNALESPNPRTVTIAGTIQSSIGCSGDWLLDCASTVLTYDPNADIWHGRFDLPPGEYEYKVALNQSWDENYGLNATRDGANIPLKLGQPASVTFRYDHKTHSIADSISSNGVAHADLHKARAHWVARDTIAWNVIGSSNYSYSLFYDPNGALTLKPGGIEGGAEIKLSFCQNGLGDAITAKSPHLGSFTALRIAPADLARIPEALKGQLAVSVRDAHGQLIDATSLQIPGVLDDLYRYTGPLGATYIGDRPTLRVWAPTARSVSLYLFENATTSICTRVAMTGDPATGVWSAIGAADWTGNYYLFEVEVYAPSLGKVVKNLVTDPYSISLSANSTRSQIVNLDDPGLKPDGWDALIKPPLAAPEDIVLYELHVRDFSIGDQSVPEHQRGTFKAFTALGSNGMRHLRRLAVAGLTHIHLLPVFDIASIEEERAARQEPDTQQLTSFPPDSPEQQRLIFPLRDRDGFNWGYDPYHYTTPEGSYATNPDGPARIREFREMVQALSSIGLRVVMDVVYNHTTASGQDEKSVLDKIVPGYYHRLNKDGAVENSTCCHNTASEHAMMEKLMVDSLRTWATAYKVDGFRFDLMGHHMVSTIVKIRDTLRALTPAHDGVDGQAIYLYGEGWDFGEVANNARGKNATQRNMAGTGIGTFNDRLRDAVRGGGAFSGFHDQGFANGLACAPNAAEQRTLEEQKEMLLRYTDWIKVGLAGNLNMYQLVSWHGDIKTGEQVQYNGQPTGYTRDPHEHVVYVSAHDNETLFDAIQIKAPSSATIAERARMASLSLSLALLSQGLPFIHAGDELLRSKSLDRNSFNSGDWFNKIDWSYTSNNWGSGLPAENENRQHWPFMRQLLANPALKPTKADILSALERFEDMLKIRKSSRLFRVRTAAEVQQKLSFLNAGPSQIPGLIVMRLQSGGSCDGEAFGQIVVLFNGTNTSQIFAEDALKGAELALHPVQAASSDLVVRAATFDNASGAFSVPAYSTAVFVGALGASA